MTQTILFDASRLLSRTERSAPTGIDRVCLAYAEWLSDHPDYEMVPVRGRKGQPAVVDSAWFQKCLATLRQRWSGLEETELRPQDKALFDLLALPVRPTKSQIEPVPVEAPTAKPVRARALRQYFRTRRVTELPQALAYINVGHTGLDAPHLLGAIKSAGIAPIILVHDLIPVTHPEYCRAGDGPKHQRRMAHSLEFGAHIIANSTYTADMLRQFAKQNALPELPVTVAHLGLEAHLSSGKPLQSTRPYFVYVGTIEARKNLAFILSVWRRLAEKMGDNAPSLVLAGRYGWENETVIDQLERSPDLQGLVHQISGLSDQALSSLMKGARAILAPSSVEGFDLPAVEASSLGLPLLASDIPPHRELTPNARLIDPLDGLGWINAVEEWTHKAPVAQQYHPPRWDEHFNIVEKQILSPLARSRTEG